MLHYTFYKLLLSLLSRNMLSGMLFSAFNDLLFNTVFCLLLVAVLLRLFSAIDDAILSTPWGFDSDYVRSPLVISDQGGAGFFDGLEKVQKQPERLRTLLWR